MLRFLEKYTLYEDYLQKENLVDFAELILKSYELIKDNEDLRNLYEKIYTYLLMSFKIQTQFSLNGLIT